MTPQQIQAIIVSWAIILMPGCRQRPANDASSIKQVDFTGFEGYDDLPELMKKGLKKLNHAFLAKMPTRNWDIIDREGNTIVYQAYLKDEDKDKHKKYLFVPKLEVAGIFFGYQIQNFFEGKELISEIKVYDWIDQKFIKGASQTAVIDFDRPLGPQIGEYGDMMDYLSGVARAYFNNHHPKVVEKFELFEKADFYTKSLVVAGAVALCLVVVAGLIASTSTSATSLSEKIAKVVFLLAIVSLAVAVSSGVASFRTEIKANKNGNPDYNRFLNSSDKNNPFTISFASKGTMGTK